MEFRILGPLEVVDGDALVEIAGAKRKAVLALLVLRANEVVRSEWLIDELWGERAPRNAAAALHNHVSRLRKAVGPETLARREWGYVLRVQPESIDLRRFEDLLAVAESEPARERAETLREALDMWRGPPLADLVLEPALERDIARLEEVRLSALERRIDADLEAGRASELVGELETLIAENPLREHLRWQLILALYRAGRQAEALEVYRETRRVLAEELGLDPSPALRELETAILRQDPALVVPPPPPSAVTPAPVVRKRHQLYAGVLGLTLLAGAGAVAATTISRRGRLPQAAPTLTVRTVLETIHRSVTTATTETVRARSRTHAAHAAVRAQASKPAHPVSHTHATVTASTVVAHATHATRTVKHADKKKTTTTATTTTTRTKPVRIADDFSEAAADPRTWWSWDWGSGPTADQSTGRLVFSIPANPQFDPQYSITGANYSMMCRFLGDFDARVDYTLVNWSPSNGAAVSMTAATNEWTWVLSREGGMYSSWPDGQNSPTADTSGSLRVTRFDNVLTTYFRRGGQWRKLGTTNLRGEVRLELGVSAGASAWQHTDASAAFDNFVVTAPDADCPPGDDPRG